MTGRATTMRRLLALPHIPISREVCVQVDFAITGPGAGLTCQTGMTLADKRSMEGLEETRRASIEHGRLRRDGTVVAEGVEFLDMIHTE